MFWLDIHILVILYEEIANKFSLSIFSIESLISITRHYLKRELILWDFNTSAYTVKNWPRIKRFLNAYNDIMHKLIIQ